MLGGFSVLSDIPQAALGNIRPAAVPSHGSDDNPTSGTLSRVFWKERGCLKTLETTCMHVIFWSISHVSDPPNFSMGSFFWKLSKQIGYNLHSFDSSLMTPWHKWHFLQELVKDSVRDLWGVVDSLVGLWPLADLQTPQRVYVQQYRPSFHSLFIRGIPRSTISSKPEVEFQIESKNQIKAFLIVDLLKTCSAIWT